MNDWRDIHGALGIPKAPAWEPPRCRHALYVHNAKRSFVVTPSSDDPQLGHDDERAFRRAHRGYVLVGVFSHRTRAAQEALKFMGTESHFGFTVTYWSLALSLGLSTSYPPVPQ